MRIKNLLDIVGCKTKAPENIQLVVTREQCDLLICLDFSWFVPHALDFRSLRRLPSSFSLLPSFSNVHDAGPLARHQAYNTQYPTPTSFHCGIKAKKLTYVLFERAGCMSRGSPERIRWVVRRSFAVSQLGFFGFNCSGIVCESRGCCFAFWLRIKCGETLHLVLVLVIFLLPN